jgi:outer membrane receptor protein involved in Fe transport
VKPEKADTVTFGFVYRPRWLEGADLSVDWLDVSLKDAIQAFTAQDIIKACYQQGNTDQCQYIDRSGPNNTIFIVNQTVQNVSKAKIRGVDVEMGYARPVHWFGGAEHIGVRLFTSWLGENSITSSNGVKTEYAGDTGVMALPRWKVTSNLSYARGGFDAYAQARYIGSGKLSALYNLNNIWDVANNSVASVTYVDTRLSYSFDAGPGSLQIYGAVSNLFDRAPPIVPAYSTFNAAPTQANPQLFDMLGRRFTLGFTFRL